MNEIKFKRDTSFRKGFFTPESFAHPAKMDAQLLIWIVEKYTGVGETILDPMAGSGTTMLACILYRDVILVELEEKFCKMMRDNWEEVKMRPQLGYAMGKCQIILGDARQLEGLQKEAKCLYGYQRHHYKFGEKCNHCGHKRGEALLVDKIVSSPPYAESTHHTDDPAELEYLRPGRTARVSGTAGESPNNIGHLPYGNVDKIITSPPHGDLMGRQSHEGPSAHGKGIKPSTDAHYGDNPDNLGNLKSQSYLSAMKTVYQQCYKVLKDGGLMILVVKNFIRNKKVIRLDTDTISLCEQAGFKFLERHYRKLPAQSFWRIIYHKKYPDVEQINHEDVLIFRR